jgi:hypothetical protein
MSHDKSDTGDSPWRERGVRRKIIDTDRKEKEPATSKSRLIMKRRRLFLVIILFKNLRAPFTP